MIPAYDFIKTNYGGINSGLQLGIAYRKDCVTLIDYETLFNSNGYEFQVFLDSRTFSN